MKKVLMPRYDGKVDLGTLDVYGGTNNVFVLYLPNDVKQNLDLYAKPIISCNEFNAVSLNDFETHKNDRDMKLDHDVLSIYDTRYNTTTDFKTAMNGVYLYYETTTQPSKTKLMTVIDKRYDGRVDLGSLNWTYDSSGHKFYAPVSDIYGETNTNVKGRIKCDKYETDTQNVLDGGKDMMISTLYDNVYIRDTRYTDAATFKTAMSSVYLFYETVTQNNKTRALGAVEPIYEGRVDLGTLSWYPFGDNGGFSSGGISSNAKRYAGTEEPFIKCKGYNPTWYWKPGENKDISISPTGDIYIYNQDVEHTEQALKQALSGVYLYYETATQTRRF